MWYLFYRYLRPSMLQHLLRRLVFDVPILNEYAKMPLKVWDYIITRQYNEFKLFSTVICLIILQLLTNHYERCWKYYCLPNGWANFGVSSEEELHLTRKLFWGIFESLAHKVGILLSCLREYECYSAPQMHSNDIINNYSNLCPSTEIWCRAFQNRHALHMCDCWSNSSRLCGRQLLLQNREKGFCWCWGQLWPQTCWYH